MKSNEDLYKDLPHELFNGDVTKDLISVDEVHELADKLLKKGFSEIKRKYFGTK